MTDDIDLTPEAVERLEEATQARFGGFPDKTFGNDVADTLRALSARLAEVEAERDAAITSVDENWITHQEVVSTRDRAEAAEARLAQAVADLRTERDYWVKRADADLADQAMNERILDYPTQRKMTEAMRKADALVATLAKIGGDA